MARMRVPKPIDELFGNVEPRQLFELMQRYKAIDDKGRYLHWDQFQRRVLKGDDIEMAWLAVKMARRAMAKRQEDLQAERGACFSFCVPESLYAQLHTIDRLTGGGHALGDSPFVGASEKNRYLVHSLMMEEAITSSQLEGASTTRKVAKDMLEQNRPPRDKSEQMIFNNYLLMKKAVERKDEPLTLELMLELHEIATRDAIDNDAVPGELRRDDSIFVTDLYNEVAHQPPHWETLPERLQALCDFANRDHGDHHQETFIHPVIKAVILHFMVGYIHPFGDGNGRTARALFYWFMLKSGYWLFEYLSISKYIQEKRGDYDRAFIYTETDDFDLTYFIYHQMSVIIKAVHGLLDYIEQKRQELYSFMAWTDSSPVAQGLKRGHLEILKTAVKEPGRTFTARTVSLDLGINENTARSYLNKLVDEDLLVSSRRRGSRTQLYIAPADLKTRLKIVE